MPSDINLFDELQLFRGDNCKINDYISIHQPKISEICDIGEKQYYSDISAITSTPSQYKVQLFDMGIDYRAISDYELFLMLYRCVSEDVSKLLFNGLNICDFEVATKDDDSIFLYGQKNNIIIDELGYILISEYLRKIHFFEKIVEKAGTEKSMKYLIERDRRRLNRAKNNDFKSLLKPLVSAMVNCEHFKYNHLTVFDMHIYAFNDSVRQIQKIKNYDNLMFGLYSGSIDAKKINQKELTWVQV